jgi:small subunit ribosomal protein S16
VGAQPTEAVTAILKVTGDWQIFKGLPAPEPMLVAAPKVDKRVAFAAAAREAAGLDDKAATTPRGGGRKARPAAEAPPATAEVAAETPAEPVAETPAEPVAETPAEPVAETPAEPVATEPEPSAEA